MNNILELDQICDIADKVYFDIVNYLGISYKCVEDDPENPQGTRNTEYGEDLYYSIEEAIKNSVSYKEEYTCPKFEPTED
ncbi:MAG: hypothetical protein ACOVNU_00185 [Candidatus Kapaibacteriota bacterium]